eukprot:TRINITY_DN5337_c0_g7_i1.p1 TRINITY_DN5337_c0_g7~~TRINITY_DN5337_c0_g7_i1.p1  ORF type:complete len:129 (+),score=33.04 TRINITY_DN5337_c0_g7_i1:78-464(+)
MAGSQQELLIMAFLVAVAIVLHMLACLVVGDNMYPLIVMFMYLFWPLPFFLCGKKQESFLDSDNGGFHTFGAFIIGMFGASGPCLTGVLLHTGSITVGAGVLSLIGGVVVGAAVRYYSKLQAEDDAGF